MLIIIRSHKYIQKYRLWDYIRSLIPLVPLTTVLPFCCSFGACSGDWIAPLSSLLAGSVLEAIFDHVTSFPLRGEFKIYSR